MVRDEGLATVRALVADCLALDPGSVAPESRLVSDLGADSLDFLDLLFRLEDMVVDEDAAAVFAGHDLLAQGRILCGKNLARQ